MEGPPPIIVCGPSGVGKSVLIKKLQEVFPDKFGFSVSHTTRGPRPGEQDGKDYHFSDLETVEREVSEGKFVEHALVHGNMYGTSKEAVEVVRRAGRICILDIDVQGAKHIHEQGIWDGTRFIFINPPSSQELERRLRGRGTETEDKVQKRLANAVGEIEFSKRVGFFDHKFILDGLQGINVPKEVVELLLLLQTWYPSLGDLPEDIRVLEHFQKADRSRGGAVACETLRSVLKTLEPSFTDGELAKLLDPVCSGAADVVEYQKFLAFIFKGVAP